MSRNPKPQTLSGPWALWVLFIGFGVCFAHGLCKNRILASDGRLVWIVSVGRPACSGSIKYPETPYQSLSEVTHHWEPCPPKLSMEALRSLIS